MSSNTSPEMIDEDDPYASAPLTRLDLQLNLNLPANAPQGHPHLIDMYALLPIDDGLEIEGLSTVDVIASTLYEWDPTALENLLNLTNTEFFWAHGDTRPFINYAYYVSRKGRNVRVGSIGIGANAVGWPDFEVHYHIDSAGCWKIIGGRALEFTERIHYLTTEGHRLKGTKVTSDVAEHEQSCNSYDLCFAKHIMSNMMWVRHHKKQFFRYEVNGENMFAKQRYMDDCEVNAEN